MHTFTHIRKRAEFLQLRDKSKKINTKHFILSYASTLVEIDDDGYADIRLGIVATTKIGNAVARNRAKRLVREAFRRNKKNFPQALDVVVICHKGIHKTTQSEIDQEMIWAAGKIKTPKKQITTEDMVG